MESSENVPRFLDDVEIIERKRLRVDSLGKQRWSLSERRQDSQNLAEMGVAVLEDCQSPTETEASTDIKENLENRSPNLRSPHSLKRPHTKSLSAVASPMSKPGSPSRTQVNRTQTKFDDCSKRYRMSNDDNSENCLTQNNINSKSRTNSECKRINQKPEEQTSCSIQYLNKENHKINTIDKYLKSSAGLSCGSSKSWDGVANPRRNDSEDRVEDSDDSLADLDCPGHNFDNIERLWSVADKKSSIQDGFGDGVVRQKSRVAEKPVGVIAETSSSPLVSLQSDVSLTSVSPRPTCLAHPALHNRPSFTSIPRHTTFDDGTLHEGEFIAEKPSTSNKDQTALQKLESSKCSQTEKESPIMNTSQLTSVDRVIFDSSITDLDRTVFANDSDEQFYFKPADTVSEIVTDDNVNNKTNKIINAEQSILKNSKKTIESVNMIKNEKIDSNTFNTSLNKKDFRKRGVTEKQSSLKAYFFVNSDKKNNKVSVENKASTVIITAGNTDSNLEQISNSVQTQSTDCRDNFKENKKSDIKNNLILNVTSNVLASPVLKNSDYTITEDDVCVVTPLKNIQSNVSPDKHSIGSCEACGDKKGYCNSHSKTPAVTRQDGGMFGKLSDEMVLSILQWLPKRTIVRCMLVSRRWRRLGADSRLWARVDLGGRVLPPGSLATLMERHPVALRLANAQLISPVILPPSQPIELAEILKWRIQYLDLSAASVSTACLAAILDASTGLIRLSLEGLSLGQQGGKALMRLTKLKSLNLALTTGIGAALSSKQNLDSDFSVWPQCESLNMGWCQLEAEDLNALCELLPSALQRLNLSGCRKTMTDTMVGKIVLRCPSLVELDLSDCANLMSEGVREFLKLPLLEHLALSRCYRLLLQDYVQLSGCQSLQWLDVFGLLPNLSTPILQRSLPNLNLNKFIHSSIARPTVGNRRTSIWGLRTRD